LKEQSDEGFVIIDGFRRRRETFGKNVAERALSGDDGGSDRWWDFWAFSVECGEPETLAEREGG
jgi:hypothetical protein